MQLQNEENEKLTKENDCGRHFYKKGREKESARWSNTRERKEEVVDKKTKAENWGRDSGRGERQGTEHEKAQGMWLRKRFI